MNKYARARHIQRGQARLRSECHRRAECQNDVTALTYFFVFITVDRKCSDLRDRRVKRIILLRCRLTQLLPVIDLFFF